jgi:CheY-like chemotaxis protein
MDSDLQRTVFVVDDEPAIAEIMSEGLRDSGLREYAFHNGQEALDYARVEPPDLVLSDVNMPRMDGLTLAAELRKLYPHCKLILMSGATPSTAEIEILQKPIAPKVILGDHELCWNACLKPRKLSAA